ncbi:MAG: endonuclease III domain-containing protein [Candidatus Aquicultorales bacterium]
MVSTVMEAFEPHLWAEGLTPFEVLVSTVLSQKTERRGTKKAFMALKLGLGITPRSLAEAGEERIAELIKPAGMFRTKSAKLKALAGAVIERHDGDLEMIFGLPDDRARAALMALPGVGPKTADVVLSFVARKEILAVDVHIFRVAERWHAVPKGAKYEEVRAALEAAVQPQKRVAAHLALIEFGREICVARKPKCEICPVNDRCPSAFTF